MRNIEEKRLQRVVATVCATLFAVFAFLFVAVYQAPLLEAFYNEVATGKLDYNQWFVGGVVSLLLTLLALWLNGFAKLRREWTALAYLPSALLLAFITDIDRGLYTGDGAISTSWIYIFATCFLICVFVAFVLRRILFEKIKDARMVTNRVLWNNMVLIVLSICLIGALSNSEENFKRETLMMSHYNKGDTLKALRVGKTSLSASRELTFMRAYVLAVSGGLGESLFEYPQYYGTEGLLPAVERTSPLVPDSVYALIGAKPEPEESVSRFIERAMQNDTVSNNVTREYYFASLLLDKKLREFKDALFGRYGKTIDKLPKHYREALMLYEYVADSTDVVSFSVNDDAMRKRMEDFRAEEAKHADPVVRGNYIRRYYGDTYWWYFLYGKKE